MPGFSNVIYRFYSSIDWLSDVLALHECKVAHWFNKSSANLESLDRRDIYSVTSRSMLSTLHQRLGCCFCTEIVALLAYMVNTEVNYKAAVCIRRSSSGDQRWRGCYPCKWMYLVSPRRSSPAIIAGGCLRSKFPAICAGDSCLLLTVLYDNE